MSFKVFPYLEWLKIYYPVNWNLLNICMYVYIVYLSYWMGGDLYGREKISHLTVIVFYISLPMTDNKIIWGLVTTWLSGPHFWLPHSIGLQQSCGVSIFDVFGEVEYSCLENTLQESVVKSQGHRKLFRKYSTYGRYSAD